MAPDKCHSLVEGQDRHLPEMPPRWCYLDPDYPPELDAFIAARLAAFVPSPKDVRVKFRVTDTGNLEVRDAGTTQVPLYDSDYFAKLIRPGIRLLTSGTMLQYTPEEGLTCAPMSVPYAQVHESGPVLVVSGQVNMFYGMRHIESAPMFKVMSR